MKCFSSLILNWFQNPANKDDFLGEYTGELISHTEAEKRGKLYERADFSFLFDLDDEVTLMLIVLLPRFKYVYFSIK